MPLLSLCWKRIYARSQRSSLRSTTSPGIGSGLCGHAGLGTEKNIVTLRTDEENVAGLHSSAKASTTGLCRYSAIPALLFLQLLGAQYLPPPPGAGFLVATGSAICMSPAPACPLLIRTLR